MKGRDRGPTDDPARAEAYALATIDGVGGDREWWFWNPEARVGHLRVALTADEAERLPPWCGPVDDAGESGPERSRTLSHRTVR